MQADPGRCVQCRLQPVAGVERGGNPLLKIEHRAQPQFAEQHVARGEAVIERPDRGLETVGYRADCDGGWARYRGDCQGRVEEVAIIEFRSSHRYRICILELTIK